MQFLVETPTKKIEYPLHLRLFALSSVILLVIGITVSVIYKTFSILIPIAFTVWWIVGWLGTRYKRKQLNGTHSTRTKIQN